jgi:predicted DNA-binding transcriptional regulator AlpA
MPQDTTLSDLLTTREAAAVLGIQAQTLHAWRAARRESQPAYVRIGSRAVKYRRADLEAYINRNTVGSID